jgi:hypothetical protein
LGSITVAGITLDYTFSFFTMTGSAHTNSLFTLDSLLTPNLVAGKVSRPLPHLPTIAK